VDDAVNLGVLGKDVVERGLVGDIDLMEDGPAAAEQLDAVEGGDGRVVEVVDDDDLVAVLEQGQRREGANVSGSAVWFRRERRPPGRLAQAWRCGAPVVVRRRCIMQADRNGTLSGGDSGGEGTAGRAARKPASVHSCNVHGANSAARPESWRLTR